VESEFTLPDVSQTVIITRLEGRTPVPEKEKLKDLAQHQASMAIFLSVHMIERVVNELKEAYGPDTAVAVVSKASWPDEEVVKGTLNDIALKVKEAGIKKTSMILVGDFLDGDYSYSKLYDKNFSHAYRKGEGENMKAILVVSFGTSYHETRKLTIEACEQAIADKFSDYELRRAFTSNMIIKKMKERDKIYVDTPIEALKKLKEEGFSEVIIQPLHIIPGSEYHDLYMEARNYKDYFEKLIIGKPLLYDVKDYIEVARGLESQLPSLKEKEAVVFMGHGTEHPANSAYANLDYVFKDLGMNNVHMATVEGYPELENVIRKLKANNSEKVALMPFMLVAGDHAQNDMASDDEDSWKSILKEEGFEVETYLHGIGENKEMQKLYIGKVNELINN